MRDVKRLIYIFRNLVLITGSVIVCSCFSSPSVKSPGTPASSTSSTSSSQNGTDSGNRSDDGDSSKASTKQAGAGKEQDGADAAGKTQQGDSEKSDDQILAEALEEFDNEIKNSQQGAVEPPDGPRPPTAAASGNGSEALTDEEKSKLLNRQLDEKFAKFDDMMLGEREAVTKQDNEEGNGNGRYGGDGIGDSESGADGDGGGDGQEGPLQTAMTDDNPNNGKSGAGIKSDIPNDSVSAEPPPDIDDGQGDDIIARQLREAAMKEQDPELRKRLWDEYRKYKKGMQANR